jgi:hypothetical protein
MVKIDEQVARCFSRLKSDEFRPLVSFLESKYQEDLKNLVYARDVETMHILQGQLRAYAELLDYVKVAEDLVAKFMKHNH